MNDFYIRPEDDPYYKPDIYETSSLSEQLVNQIKILLGTVKKDILGVYNMGIDLYDYLFKKNINLNKLESEMNEQLLSFSELAYNMNVHIEANEITTNDNKRAIIFDIYVDDKKVFGILF